MLIGATRHLSASLDYFRTFEWSDLARVQSLPWSNLRPGRATRVALGVFVPLIVGVATGDPTYGSFAALGALPAGFASLQGSSRSRIRAVALSSVGVAIGTFVGATTAASVPWMIVPTVAVFGFVVGSMVSLGPRLSVAAFQWPVALLIGDAVPLSPSAAAVRAGFVLAGGALQALLVVSSWLVRPGRTEAQAVADTYRKLAGYAREVAAGARLPPPPDPTPEELVAEANPLLAESARLELTRLSQAADTIRATLAYAAGLDAPPRLLDLVAQELERIADLVSGAPRTSEPAALTDPQNQWLARSLDGQLRRAARFATRFNDTSHIPSLHRTGKTDGSAQRFVLATLVAGMNTHSEGGRHALRLGLSVAVAETLALALHPNESHWIALTVLVVLKPDYGATLSRGIQRAVGTLLGAGLGVAIVELGHFGEGATAVAASICIALAYAVFEVSYAVFTVLLTGFVVVLLSYLGISAASAAPARALDTVIGTALALVAFAVWPTWEAVTGRGKLAAALSAQGRYAGELLRQLPRPAPDLAAVRERQRSARAARAAAQASAERVGGEPAHRDLAAGQAEAIVAALRELARTELAVHSVLVHSAEAGRPAAPPADEANLRRLADRAERTLTGAGRYLLAREPPGPAGEVAPDVPEVGGRAGPLVARLLAAAGATAAAVAAAAADRAP